MKDLLYSEETNISQNKNTHFVIQVNYQVGFLNQLPYHVWRNWLFLFMNSSSDYSLSRSANCGDNWAVPTVWRVNC